jgi:hypothetical protein
MRPDFSEEKWGGNFIFDSRLSIETGEAIASYRVGVEHAWEVGAKQLEFA